MDEFDALDALVDQDRDPQKEFMFNLSEFRSQGEVRTGFTGTDGGETETEGKLDFKLQLDLGIECCAEKQGVGGIKTKPLDFGFIFSPSFFLPQFVVAIPSTRKALQTYSYSF